jgi:hypothetical protein
MEIDDFKNIWKEQKADSVSIQEGKYMDTITSLSGLERKTKRKFIFMTIAEAFAFVIVAWVMLSNSYNSPLTYAGYIMVLFDIIAIVIVHWTTAINIKPEMLSHPSKEFLKEVVDKFYRRKFIRVYLFPVYFLILAAGITLSYVEILERMSAETKIIIYTVLYFFFIIVSIWGTRKEIRKERKEVDPIKERISNIIYQMEAEG